MKLRISGIAAVAAVSLITLTGCGSSSTTAQSSSTSAAAGGASSAVAPAGSSSAAAGGSSAAAGKGGKNACVLLPDADSSSRWENGDRPALTKAFAAAGFTTDVQNALADTGKYATLGDQMLTKGCAVMLLVDLTGAGVLVTTKAHAQGIPVIAYDRPIKGADLYISFDNFHVGELEGQMIVDGLKAANKDISKASIVYAGGDPADGNAKQFHDGADKVLKAAGMVKPAFETPGIWDAAKTGVAFQQAYTALSGKIDAVWVANDTNAGGVIQVLDKNGLKVPVSGQDGSPIGLQNILLGKQIATVYKPFQLEAAAGVAAGIKLASGAKVATTKTAADGTPFIAETPIVVTAKNMDIIFKDGAAKVSDVCTGPVAAACTAAGNGGPPAANRTTVSRARGDRTVTEQGATMAVLMELRDVRKGFGPVEVLKGVGMKIHAGTVSALVGDNGAGKSTLIKGLSGAQPYDSGEVLFEDQPVTLSSPNDAAGLGIEVVYQDLALCENLDIVMNMFLGREETYRGMLNGAEMEKHAAATLQGLSVRTMKSVRQKVSSLSGGQRQTVAIARAVLQKAKVVILDEPTAALGVAQTAQVLALVRRLADQGVGVLIISHNLADVFQVCDYINVLYLGTMVAQLDAKATSYDDVIGYITGTKAAQGNLSKEVVA